MRCALCVRVCVSVRACARVCASMPHMSRRAVFVRPCCWCSTVFFVVGCESRVADCCCAADCCLFTNVSYFVNHVDEPIFSWYFVCEPSLTDNGLTTRAHQLSKDGRELVQNTFFCNEIW